MNTNIFRHIFTSLETPPVSLVDILGDCCLLNAAHVCVANTVQFENNLDLWFSFCLFTAIQKMHSFEFQVYSFLVLVCIIYHDIIPLLPLRSSFVTRAVKVERLRRTPVTFDSNICVCVSTQLKG